jgi:hypothetical protein
MHLSAVDVAAGHQVSVGQPIAKSGNSGTASTGPHLHFAVWAASRVDALTVQPDPYLTRQGRYAVDPLRVLGLGEEDDMFTDQDRQALQNQGQALAHLFNYVFGGGGSFPFDGNFRPASRPIGAYVGNRAGWWDHMLSAADVAEAAKRPRQA